MDTVITVALLFFVPVFVLALAHVVGVVLGLVPPKE